MKNIILLKKLRQKIKKKYSLGSWIQIPNTSIAEIFGSSGYDWIALDLEHGAISIDQIPDLARAIELGNSLAFARVSNLQLEEVNRILDTGISGLIFPKIESATVLKNLIYTCTLPPHGCRGVGYSRANMFGRNFNVYSKGLFKPFIIAQIESIKGVDNLDSILKVKGLDAIFIGPYDLSASLKVMGNFNSKKFKETITKIIYKSKRAKIPYGIHLIKSDEKDLKKLIKKGFKIIACSTDSVILNEGIKYPTNF